MNTMPIRDLIEGVRKRARDLPPNQLLLAMVMNVMCNRLEQEANRADKAERELQAMIEDAAGPSI